MIRQLIYTLILFFIIKFQSPIYHYLISFPKLYFWMYWRDNYNFFKKNIAKIKKFGDTEKFFDSLENGKIHKYFMPKFDSALFLKKDLPNIFHQDISSKKNSLPYVINMFTTPHTLFGNWISDSIFRADFYERGKNNRYKEVYMEALTPDDLEIYRKYIIKYLNQNMKNLDTNYFEFVQKMNIDLTYLIHFGFLPESEDYKGSYLFINAVKNYALDMNYIYKQINNLPFFYKRTMEYILKCKNKNCLVGKWLSKGNLKPESIFMEFIHNILGMAINWTNLSYKYILDHTQDVIPDIPDTKQLRMAYMYECFRYLLPVRFTASSIKKPEDFGLNKNDNSVFIHDFKIYTQNPKYFGSNPEYFNLQRMENHQKDTVSLKGKCPFSGFFESPKGAKINCGHELYEKEGYIPFGVGYRRCPGEHLTMIYLEELAEKVKTIKYRVYLKGNPNPDNYIWGSIDRNLQIKISQF